jgi:hypothetical protein
MMIAQPKPVKRFHARFLRVRVSGFTGLPIGVVKIIYAAKPDRVRSHPQAPTASAMRTESTFRLELSADDTNGACKPTAISACRRFVGSFRQATPAMVSICGISAKAQGRLENLNCSVDSALSIRTRLTPHSATIEVASVDSRNSSANMRK